jgi:mannosyl-oligosaccharide alpha-1,3-glucosidase
MWMQYPQTEALFSLDDQYLIGADLMVKPVTRPDVVESIVIFPTDDCWYDAESLIRVSFSGKARGFVELTVPSDINKIPVFQRGGSILPRKLRLRRSSQMMMKDPYTLFVALSDTRTANGKLYMDDEETFGHDRKGEYAESSLSADFSANNGVLRNTVTVGPGWTESIGTMANNRMVERVIFMGLDSAPSGVSVAGESVGFTFDAASSLLVLRKPGVSALNDWEIRVMF